MMMMQKLLALWCLWLTAAAAFVPLAPSRVLAPRGVYAEVLP